MNKVTLQAISTTAHEINVTNGFKEAESCKRSLALIISEMAEMLEADRKGKWSKDIIKSLTERDGNLIHGMSIEQAHQFIITAEDFLGWFKETVKDTAEDELADVIIRITSYLAACEHNITLEATEENLIGYTASIFLSQSTAENIFDFMQHIVLAFNGHSNNEINLELEKIAYHCFAFAHCLGIDLEWHINAKLTYNKTRSYLHGKAY